MKTTTVQIGEKTLGRTVIPVQGMTCDGCVRTLTEALYAVEGSDLVLVDRANARATIQYDPAKTTDKALAAAITDAGYEVAAA